MHILTSSRRAVRPVIKVLDEHIIGPRYNRNMATKTGSVNFNTKHLKKGDPLPPYNGKLRLYNMRYCPFAQRTALALIAKKIDHEVINVNLMEKPEWLTSKSPFGKVPSIEIKEGLCIYESLITVEYLDEVYPDRPLMSKDPVRRAYDKIIIEAASAVTSFVIKVMKFPETITEEHIANFNAALQFVQDQLQSRGTKFLSGAQPGFVDYMIWPWFEKLLAVKKWDRRANIDGQRFKLLAAYIQEMQKDPVVVEYSVPEDILLKFFDSMKSGNVNYDLLFQE